MSSGVCKNQRLLKALRADGWQTRGTIFGDPLGRHTYRTGDICRVKRIVICVAAVLYPRNQYLMHQAAATLSRRGWHDGSWSNALFTLPIAHVFGILGHWTVPAMDSTAVTRVRGWFTMLGALMVAHALMMASLLTMARGGMRYGRYFIVVCSWLRLMTILAIGATDEMACSSLRT